MVFLFKAWAGFKQKVKGLLDVILYFISISTAGEGQEAPTDTFSKRRLTAASPPQLSSRSLTRPARQEQEKQVRTNKLLDKFYYVPLILLTQQAFAYKTFTKMLLLLNQSFIMSELWDASL